MRRRICLKLGLASTLGHSLSAGAADATGSEAAGESELRQQLQALLPGLMAKHQVPGLAMLLYRREPALRISLCLGSTGRGTGSDGTVDSVQSDTVFEAASLSKPVFGALLLQQVQAGRLELDRPLLDYFPERFTPRQPWQAKISARMLLSHTSGLPNWRSGDEERGELPLSFEPGRGFMYSGEGFYYLQRALEHLLGEALHVSAERQLFGPLGMAHSSFVLTPKLSALRARGHDEGGLPLPWSHYQRANAAYTLFTTAEDYGRFLQALLQPGLLSESLLSEALKPQSLASDRQPMQRPGMAIGSPVHWGLAWALNRMQDGSQVAYHTGTNSSGFRAYGQFSVQRGSALVMMSNGLGGHHLSQAIARTLGDL